MSHSIGAFKLIFLVIFKFIYYATISIFLVILLTIGAFEIYDSFKKYQDESVNEVYYDASESINKTLEYLKNDKSGFFLVNNGDEKANLVFSIDRSIKINDPEINKVFLDKIDSVYNSGSYMYQSIFHNLGNNMDTYFINISSSQVDKFASKMKSLESSLKFYFTHEEIIEIVQEILLSHEYFHLYMNMKKNKKDSIYDKSKEEYADLLAFNHIFSKYDMRPKKKRALLRAYKKLRIESYKSAMYIYNLLNLPADSYVHDTHVALSLFEYDTFELEADFDVDKIIEMSENLKSVYTFNNENISYKLYKEIMNVHYGLNYDLSDQIQGISRCLDDYRRSLRVGGKVTCDKRISEKSNNGLFAESLNIYPNNSLCDENSSNPLLFNINKKCSENIINLLESGSIISFEDYNKIKRGIFNAEKNKKAGFIVENSLTYLEDYYVDNNELNNKLMLAIVLKDNSINTVY